MAGLIYRRTLHSVPFHKVTVEWELCLNRNSPLGQV